MQRVPVAMHEDSLEDGVHHILDFILVFLKLQRQKHSADIFTNVSIPYKNPLCAAGERTASDCDPLADLLPLLQQQLQLVVGALAGDLVPLGLVLPLRVILVDAQVQRHVHQRRHQLHRWAETTALVREARPITARAEHRRTATGPLGHPPEPLPASVEVCLKARTWESDSPVRREITVSIMYSS